MKRRDPLKGFFDKVIKSPGCWIWQGAKSNHGYGKIHLRPRYISAHRFSYIIHKGLIPDGLCVLHSCDTPACVRPEHLFLGTMSDNTQDMIRKGRGNPPKGDRNWTRKYPERLPRGKDHQWSKNVRRGEQAPNAKLNEEKVREIRASTLTNRALAKLYGVGPSAISNIKTRTCWGHVK